MFPKNLLVTYKRKGKIYPMYLKKTILAEELITIFKNSIGKKYKIT